MESGKETLSEMLSFVSQIGMVALKNIYEDDYELDVRLETILIETLNQAYSQQTFD